MPRRKESLINNNYYHIYSRSIANFIIFNDEKEFKRMLQILNLYSFKDFTYRYSYFINRTPNERKEIVKKLNHDKKIVSIIAYCLMPTHIHLCLKQDAENGISNFMNKILNSYSHFFNIRHKRNGPLWSSRFKNVLVKTDKQLLHLTRYFHLNPTSAGLIKNPNDWQYSSYNEYLGQTQTNICEKENLFNFSQKEYKKFVENRKDYQKQLSKIKRLLIDNYPK
ncbi:MAG: transposase [Patescibacteria group bacterium]|nr:transposase [Patescibacteria group bacterium]